MDTKPPLLFTEYCTYSLCRTSFLKKNKKLWLNSSQQPFETELELGFSMLSLHLFQSSVDCSVTSLFYWRARLDYLYLSLFGRLFCSLWWKFMSQILRYIRSLFPFLIFNFERLIFCPQDKSGYILCNVNYCFISGHREPFSALLLLLFLSLTVSHVYFFYI